ncbi:MAG: lipid A biosynthesis lauroyl acyltransferase [Bradyrhizobiaceae bacterium]|nr:lipid A biosynthesis lauroyl acyltransferase [Bradyrhizobiaceae bacterium]
MKATFRRLGRRIVVSLKPAANAAAGPLFKALLKAIRHLDRAKVSDALAWFLRSIGPRLRENRVGYENLRAAFPEKSAAEIEKILRGVWDNLGRVAAEFAHLDRLCGKEGEVWPFVEYAPDSLARFKHLRSDGKPALVFAAHLANWELPAVIAAKNGLDTMVLYRRPNIGAVADAVIDIRQGSMGTLVPTNFDAPVRLSRALADSRHVAMLVDQHYVNGPEVTFFGRRCLANPLIAMLARQIDCPIYGTRVVRLGRYRFRAELSEPIPPVRDPDGRVNIAGTMQAITSVIEGWIREHPEQWLWVHRRWR